MLTKIDVVDVAGINGVPWDAVELAEPILENWCWEEEALAFISRHYETGKPLPKEKIRSITKSEKLSLQCCLFYGQLEFGLFDFRLHHYFEANKPNQILATLKQVKSDVAKIMWIKEHLTALVIFLQADILPDTTAIFG